MWRRLGFALVGIAGVYLIVLVALVALMMQPPEVFARAIARIPEPLFSMVPFGRLWTWARAGHLRVGDPAPDFLLGTYSGKELVQLSSFKGRRPVVLVFGSYT